METSRALEIRFRLTGSDKVSPEDFISLFRCAEAFSRSVTEAEALSLLDHLDAPSEARLDSLRRLHAFGRKLPLPVEVARVERGSWSVDVAIYGAALLFVLKEYLHPVVKEAWDESDIRARVKSFLQDKVFRRARQTAEQKAVRNPEYGRLRVTNVSPLESTEPDRIRVEVTLERGEITYGRASDDELVEEFIRTIMRRKDAGPFA